MLTDCMMRPHAKSIISSCMPCVITPRQQALRDIVNTLLHRLTAVGYYHVCMERLKLQLVDDILYEKFATNSQQINLMELEP